MKHLAHCLKAAARHPLNAVQGAREFRGDCGITYPDPDRSEAYDAGRELAHMVTRRRYDTYI